MVVGRDVNADLRIPDPRISRAHLIVRFDQGRWLAIDNGSLNGTYVNGYRMPVIDIHDGQSINVGNPQGPRLTFAIGPQQGQTSRPPQTRPTRESGPPTLAWSALPETTNPTAPPAPQRGQTGSQPRNPAWSGPNLAPPRPMPPRRRPASRAHPCPGSRFRSRGRRHRRRGIRRGEAARWDATRPADGGQRRVGAPRPARRERHRRAGPAGRAATRRVHRDRRQDGRRVEPGDEVCEVALAALVVGRGHARAP